MRPCSFPMSRNVLFALLLLSALILPTAGVAAAQETCNPLITVDNPAQGGALRGLSTIQGWAVDTSGPGNTSGVQNVFFYLDSAADHGGTYLGEAALGSRDTGSADPSLVRSDVDAALGRQNNRAGFVGSVDVGNVASGQHPLFVYAETRCGFSNIQLTVNVEAGASITLAAPAPDSAVVLGSNLTVSGRATDPAGPESGVTIVDVYVDGPAGTGAGIGRAQLNTATGEFTIPWTVAGPPGVHSLYVYAMTSSSGWVSKSFNLSVGTTAAPAAVTVSPGGQYLIRIENPPSGAVLNSTRNFTGFAVDCATGRPPTRMRAYTGTGPGGTFLVEATPTENRELDRYCNRTGSADVGFDFSLDTRRLEEGTQTISLVAEFADATITQTVTVFIDNEGNGNLNNYCLAFDVTGRCISYTNTNALYGQCSYNPNFGGTFSNTTFCNNITLDQAGQTVAPNAIINLTGQIVCNFTNPGAGAETVTVYDRTQGSTSTIGRASTLSEGGVYRVSWNTQGVQGTRTLEVASTGSCGPQSAYFTIFVGTPGPGLSAPQNLSLTANSLTTVTLSWTPIASPAFNPAGITGYRIYRSSTGQTGSFSLLQFVSGASASTATVIIQAGTTPSFYVSAVDAQGRESGPSNEVSAGTPGITITGLTATKNPAAPAATCPATPCVVRFAFTTNPAAVGTVRWGIVGSGRPNAQSDAVLSTSHTIDVTFPTTGTFEYQITAGTATTSGASTVQTISIP